MYPPVDVPRDDAGGEDLKVLIIINDAPYGTERAYNALRLAMSMQREEPDAHVQVFLMADAVTCALPGQTTPDGYYSIGTMLRSVLAKGGEVAACGTCMDARGVRDLVLVDGVEAGTMKQLTRWVAQADRVVSF
jgi:uncharacterized protein involved in oxidation of intracellular sulfur